MDRIGRRLGPSPSMDSRIRSLPFEAQTILRSADPNRLRLIANAVALHASEREPRLPEPFHRAVRSLGSGEPDRSTGSELARLAESFDESYLALRGDEDAETPHLPGMEDAADLARAASAIAAAFDPDPLRAATEAIYEASFVGENGDGEIVEFVRSLA
jgi:hypothetical protein